MKRRKTIRAFNTPIGVGFAHIEPIPTMKPPSLGEDPEESASEILRRLYRQNKDEKVRKFHTNYLKHQMPTMPPHVVTSAPLPPAYLYFPMLVGSAGRKRNR